MQKELRLLDEELSSNNLVRVIDPNFKSDKSLFKSISLSIYYTEDHYLEVIRLMKLTLYSSVNSDQKTNPFPIAYSRSKFVPNFQNNEELIRMYYEKPDLNCFSQVQHLEFRKTYKLRPSPLAGELSFILYRVMAIYKSN